MNNEKIPAGEIKSNSAFLRWLDNYWYHNKTKTIIILFVIFVGVILIVQMCSTEGEDITLLYSGPVLMTGAEREEVRALISGLLPKDYDGDGQKRAEIVAYQVMSASQLKELEGGTGAVGPEYFTKEYQNYTNILYTGECSVLFLDPWLCEGLAESDRLQKLTDILGASPDGAYNEYGVRLGDTALYRHYKSLQILPADTVICLHKPYVFGKSSDEDSYNQAIDVFKAIINFVPPQS